MKQKKLTAIVLIMFAVILSSCSKAPEAVWAEDEDMAFESILPGETTYRELAALEIKPVRDLDLAELSALSDKPREGHYLDYGDFEVFTDKTVRTINIKPMYEGEVLYGITMSDTLPEALAKLPQEPEVYEIRQEDTPFALPSYEDSGYLEKWLDDEGKVTEQTLTVFSAGGINLLLVYDAEGSVQYASIGKQEK